MARQAKSFTLSGVAYYESGYDLTILHSDAGTEIPEMATPRVFEAALAGANGSVMTGATFEAQDLALRCACEPTGESTLDECLQNITAALAAVHTANTEAALVLHGRGGQTRWVRLLEVAIERRGLAAFLSLKFRESNPGR